ncbi:HAD domain-containing protein [Noviherbaspirillum aridicola]|uniref:HAD domain-containing protein n=1 Tax=Noviherbaspirillum aridicola TaxID=2849687 RepID=UPI001C813911
MVLFLDFDGVLHPIDRGDGLFSCLPLFEQTVRQLPPLDIVVSSSWRVDHSLEELRAIFSADIAAQIVGVTPYHTDGFTAERYGRESEARAWLQQFCRESEPWLALDDSDWMFSPHCTQLILVDPAVGFSHAEVIRLSQIVGFGPTSPSF